MMWRTNPSTAALPVLRLWMMRFSPPGEGGRGVIEKAARNRYRTDLLMHPSGGSVLLRIVCVSLAVFDIMPSSRSAPRTPALLGDRAPSQRQL